jgi:hypothetical protein
MDDGIHLFTATSDDLVHVFRPNGGILGCVPTGGGAGPALDTGRFPRGSQPFSSEGLMGSGSPSVPAYANCPQSIAEVSLLIGCGASQSQLTRLGFIPSVVIDLGYFHLQQG